MPTTVSPTENWFINLQALQSCMKNLNHLTPNDLKQFSKSTLKSLASTVAIQQNLAVCCQNAGIGLVPANAFADLNKTFFWFLETVGVIALETSLRLQIYTIVVKYRPELINSTVAQVMNLSIDAVFGVAPLNSNIGKKELDFKLNDSTPDVFYPVDGSFLNNGNKTLAALVKNIIS
jgi:hypothetical protein